MRDANLRVPEEPAAPRVLFGWPEVLAVIGLTILGVVLALALAAFGPDLR
jgi:hypothetical protein